MVYVVSSSFSRYAFESPKRRKIKFCNKKNLSGFGRPPEMFFSAQQQKAELVNYLHVVVEKDVSEFEVPVDDAFVVEIFASEEDLIEEISTLRLRHGLSTLVQLH